MISKKSWGASVLVGVAAFLGLWQALVVVGWMPEVLLPGPTRVFRELASMIREGGFWVDLGTTVTTWIASVVVGFLLGGLVGMALALNEYVWAAAEPMTEFLRALPSVVLVPLVALFFGVGWEARLAAGSLVVFVLMLATSGAAVRSARHAHLKLAMAWGLGTASTARHILVPAALSQLLVALKAAVPIALIVTVAADMLIATETGIGTILMDSLAAFNSPRLFAGILVVGLLGYGAAILSSTMERLTVHWSGQ